ncbi:hypothetical protein BDB01DRAFT_772832 [Pilobolus umbonatus]|nr:hypothetical protein BDB01DRAFT_772832 [Pilobolus umbonatus]
MVTLCIHCYYIVTVLLLYCTTLLPYCYLHCTLLLFTLLFVSIIVMKCTIFCLFLNLVLSYSMVNKGHRR